MVFAPRIEGPDPAVTAALNHRGHGVMERGPTVAAPDSRDSSPAIAGEGDHAKHGGGGGRRLDRVCGRPLPSPDGATFPRPAGEGSSRLRSHTAAATLACR